MLATTSIVIFSQNAFWGNMNLEALGKIASTCKEFKKEVYENQASFLKLIMDNEKSIRNKEFYVRDAMSRLSLSLPTITRFLKNLPPANTYYLPEGVRYVRERKIPVIYAHHLAMERSGGMKTVAKLNNKAIAKYNKENEKLVNDGRAILVDAEERFAQMHNAVTNAIQRLKDENHRDIRGRVTIMKSMRHYLERVQTKADILRLHLDKKTIDRKDIKDASKKLQNDLDGITSSFTSHRRLNTFMTVI